MASLIHCTFSSFPPSYYLSSLFASNSKSSIARCFPRIRNSEILFVVNPSVFIGNGNKPFTNAKFACNSGVSDISDINKASEIEHSKAHHSKLARASKAEAIAHSKSSFWKKMMWCARPLQRAVSVLKAGLAAGEEDVVKVEFAAKELESIGGPVDLFKESRETAREMETHLYQSILISYGWWKSCFSPFC